ncbi:MAG: hypothetical protein J6J11_01770 [Treponema sp.]|nr:hypothetical protein [Treponema sp.]
MVQVSWCYLGGTMDIETKANKKVRYAIRMLSWHTRLARRYYDIVKSWLDSNNINYDTDLMNYIEKNKKRENDNQLTIYDFL